MKNYQKDECNHYLRFIDMCTQFVCFPNRESPDKEKDFVSIEGWGLLNFLNSMQKSYPMSILAESRWGRLHDSSGRNGQIWKGLKSVIRIYNSFDVFVCFFTGEFQIFKYRFRLGFRFWWRSNEKNSSQNQA